MREVGSGAAIGAALFAGAAAAHLPLRVQSARIQAEAGARFADHLAGGLAADLAVLLPVLFAAWSLLFATLLLLRRGRPGLPARPAAAAHALLGLLLSALCLAGVAAAEFRLQRGLWPTLWDVRSGAGDIGFWSLSARTFLLERHRASILASLAVIALAQVFIVRRLTGTPGKLRPLRLVGGVLFAMALGFGLARVVYLRSNRGLLPTVVDREAELLPPLRHFIRTAGVLRTGNNAWVSAAGLLRGARLPPGDGAAGAAMLGLPATAGATVAPGAGGAFARALPGEEAAATEPVERALDLSRALYGPDSPPPAVLEVMLESFRATEVSALTPATPTGIAPFADALYRGTHGLPAIGVGASQAWQGGLRTSQALAAAVCGIGHLPFTWSLARDFGKVPARCLTDVLADAGFTNRFFVGGSLVFDNMGLFFSSHAVRPYGSESLPADIPKASWGSTDRAFFRETLKRFARDEAGIPRWDLVLSMNNHGPYVAPPDVPAEVVRRVDEALGPRRAAVSEEERTRLTTFSYTDFALEELLRGYFGAAGERAAIVVVHADHATGDPSPWQTGVRNPAGEVVPDAARIPLVLLVPEGLIARAADPTAARRALERLGHWLENHPVSANDLPTLVLALLSSSPQLRQLRAEARWHTLGGQATSPWLVAPGTPRGQVWGIDAFSRLFVLNSRGTGFPFREQVLPVSSAAEVAASNSRIRPAAAVIRQFLDGSPAGAGD